ncbi:hypothetical protein AAG927_011815 [Enterobacter hormaechei]
MPGIIILVHGVNSTGEWFSIAEDKICEGLNKRLGLKGTDYKLVANKYFSDEKIEIEPLIERDLPAPKKETSPVIRFYWGMLHLKVMKINMIYR